MPPVKNFIITEKDKGSSSLKEAFSLDKEEQENMIGEGAFGSNSQKKNFVIVTIIVFLAAVFAVGIYFAVDLSNQ